MRILSTKLFVSILFTFILITHASAQWVRRDNGMSGGDISAITTIGALTFAGTQGGGVFMSSDNGSNWTAINTALNNLSVRVLAVRGGVLYAGTTQGLFRVNVGGPYVWQSVNTGLSSQSIWGITSNSTNIFIASLGGGIATSADDGASWSVVNTGLTNLIVSAVFAFGNDVYCSNQLGVFKSTNNGLSWASANTGFATSSVPGSFAALGADIFGVTVNNGVYKSSNNGGTWTQVNTGLTDINTVSIISHNSTLVVGTLGGGVFLSSNSGASWATGAIGLTSPNVNALATNGSNLFAGTPVGIFRSTNDGNNWQATNSGIRSIRVTSLLTNVSTFFAGASGGVYKSIDNGVSWIEANNGLTNTQVSCLALSGTTLFAGTLGGGVFRSADNGLNWTPVNSGLANMLVQTLFVRGSNIFAGTDNGLFISSDNGANWVAASGPAGRISALGSVGSVIIAASSATLHRSTDNGASWTPGPGIAGVRCFATVGTTLYAGGTGVQRSFDGGATWSGASVGLGSNLVNALYSETSVLLAATNIGIYFSGNGAESWANISTGLPSNAYTNAVNFIGSEMAVGTEAYGVWARPFSELIPSVSSVTPASGVVGSTVTISGTNFSSTIAGNSVAFNGTPSTVFGATPTSITTRVPGGATTGPITVRVNTIPAQTTPTFMVIQPPVITAFTPVRGIVGQSVTITGEHFNSMPGDNEVRFNGMLAAVSASSPTELRVSVPAGATTGPISVRVNSITSTSSGNFTIDVPPTITSFNPVSGATGTTVIISGANFSTVISENVVRFNGVVALVSAASANSLTVTVPASATTGRLSVDVRNLSVVSTNDFVVFQTPVIQSFSPSEGPVGATIIIEGNHFSTTPTQNVVNFNGTPAVVSTASVNSLTVTVPNAAISGRITVTTNSLTGTSASDFTVLQPPVISSFSPSQGHPGTIVTITGNHFSTTPASNSVSFNGTSAVVQSASQTTLVVAVPLNASTGPIVVTVNSIPATSAQSFTVTAPPDTSEPVITNTTGENFTGNELAITARMSDPESGIAHANLAFRFISGSNEFQSMALSASDENYSILIPTGDESLGVEFRFEVTDGAGLSRTTDSFYSRRSIEGAGIAIPYSAYGNEVSDYRIVAVPLELAASRVADVFDELGSMDQRNWRISHFTNNENRELGPTSVLETGKGYWLIIRENQREITSGRGTVAEVSGDDPFEVQLSQGWNQIGNPYLFNVSWVDVQTANPGLGGLRQYEGTFVDSDILDAMEGGFVFASAPTAISIPVTRNQSVNGRTHTGSRQTYNALNWELYLNVRHGKLQNKIAAFGMNESASDGSDSYDGLVMPRLFDSWIEVRHLSSGFSKNHSKDIVPSSKTHTWSFVIESTGSDPVMELTWDKQYFTDDDVKVYLIDKGNHTIVNMKKSGLYRFRPTKENSFEVAFGPQEFINSELKFNSVVMFSPWPNPAEVNDVVNLSFSVPDHAGPVALKIYDMLGRVVWQQVRMWQPGLHEVRWTVGNEVGPGAYVIEVSRGVSSDKNILILR